MLNNLTSTHETDKNLLPNKADWIMLHFRLQQRTYVVTIIYEKIIAFQKYKIRLVACYFSHEGCELYYQDLNMDITDNVGSFQIEGLQFMALSHNQCQRSNLPSKRSLLRQSYKFIGEDVLQTWG